MRLLYRGLFFFIFFVSFCIINVSSLDWGLQVSWFLALIIYIAYPLFCSKVRISFTRNFKVVTMYFFVILINTIISIILINKGIITFNDVNPSELVDRSCAHIVYVVFEYIMFLYIYVYLYNSKNHTTDLKYFITYPALFITIWGIYQWITTFDVIPYAEIFNNSLSTKFTYLRFKAVHRTASVFPEPSEYAYFLSFMLPFTFAAIKRSQSVKYITKPKLFVFLILISILLCQSMSLFCVIPLMFLYLARSYMKLTFRKIFLIALLLMSLVGAIFILSNERISAISTGDDGSAITRFGAFVETVDLVKNSPLIGAGFGAVRGLDLLSFLLGTTGVVGTLCFIYMVCKLKSYSSTNTLFIQGFKCMLIVALISNPIIDLTFFWPILAFISIPLRL